MNEISLARILLATACPGGPFGILRAVSPAKRGIEWPRRARPVVTGWAESFTFPNTRIPVIDKVISFPLDRGGRDRG